MSGSWSAMVDAESRQADRARKLVELIDSIVAREAIPLTMSEVRAALTGEVCAGCWEQQGGDDLCKRDGTLHEWAAPAEVCS